MFGINKMHSIFKVTHLEVLSHCMNPLTLARVDRRKVRRAAAKSLTAKLEVKTSIRITSLKKCISLNSLLSLATL